MDDGVVTIQTSHEARLRCPFQTEDVFLKYAPDQRDQGEVVTITQNGQDIFLSRGMAEAIHMFLDGIVGEDDE